MKKKILIKLGAICIPVGAILLSACGPVEGMDSELALKEANSDNWGLLSEWGHCLDAWDNDGNGLVDMADPACHINPGPLRDLSLYSFPKGHNFFPDISRMFPGGAGWPGDFRDRDQITRWFRFLTEPDGNVAGIDVYGPGVNAEVVPVPAILPEDIEQGTAAQGNNGIASLRGLHEFYLDHDGIPAPVAPAAPVASVTVIEDESADQAPSPIDVAATRAQRAALEFAHPFYNQPVGFIGGWPGEFYKGGSQGALRPSRMGNED